MTGRRLRVAMLAALVALAAAGSVMAAAAARSARPQVELECASFGDGPQLECLVRLRTADGAPLRDAQVTLGASMPSMPMAHSVRPVAAGATERPGEYRGVLRLEMTGVWAVQVDVGGSVRDRVVRSLRIDSCEAARRCPALSASEAPRMPHTPHKH